MYTSARFQGNIAMGALFCHAKCVISKLYVALILLSCGLQHRAVDW
jgi:hypothetical protein